MGSPQKNLAKVAISRSEIRHNSPQRPSPNKRGSSEDDIVISPTGSDDRQMTPGKSLLETRNKASFNHHLAETIGRLVSTEIDDEGCIPEQVLSLARQLENVADELGRFSHQYRSDTVWDNIKAFGRSLENALQSMGSAMAELKHYIPSPSSNREYKRSISLESLESVMSDKEACAQPLKTTIQAVYQVVQTRFNDYVRCTTEAFAKEPRMIDRSSLSRVAVASSVMSVLGMLVAFETRPHELDPRLFALTIPEQLLKERQQLMLDMFLTLCRHLMFLQESLFVKEHLLAKGPYSIKLLENNGKMMWSCWRELKAVFDRMTDSCPMYTDIAQEYYGRLLWHAASLTAGMQDSHDLTDFLTNGRSIPYEAVVVSDIAKSQHWLLFIIKQLVVYISRASRRIKLRLQRRERRPQAAKLSKLAQDLKQVTYDLIMTTIGRASWLISYPDQSSKNLITTLKGQGTIALQLVLHYSKSSVSLQCDKDSTVKDVTNYSALVCATNELRNGALQLHNSLLRFESIAEEPDVTVDSNSSAKETEAIIFHQVPGTDRLQHRLSVKPHPVEIDGSAEFEIGTVLQKERSLGRYQSTGSDDLEDLTTSPWAILDSVTEEGSHDLSYHNELDRNFSYSNSEPSSAASLDLPTTFADIDNDDGDDVLHRIRSSARESAASRSSIQRSKRSNPFAEQQPSERPSASRTCWGSVSGADSAASSEPVSVLSSGLVKDVLASDLLPGPIIGEGSEGHVLQMSYHKTPVAVKIMNRTCMRTRERFKNETKLLSKLSDHPNIVSFVGQCKNLRGDESRGSDLVMVMEYCDLGNLFKIISEARWVQQLHGIGRDLRQFESLFGYLLYMDWKRRLQIACDIAAGATHMHEHDIVHRDLTSFNVVLKTSDDGTWTAKICDFERSRKIPDGGAVPRSDNVANSPAWSSPEVLREEPYTLQSDVFSFGVILWELWTLEEPWKYGDCDVRNPLMIIPLVGNGARLKIPSLEADGPVHLPQLKALIEACWNDNPKERPTMQEAYYKLVEMTQQL